MIPSLFGLMVILPAAVAAPVAVDPESVAATQAFESAPSLAEAFDAAACRTFQPSVPNLDGSPEFWSLDVPLDGGTVSFALSRHSVRAPGFRVIDGSGREWAEIASAPPATYRGAADGQPNLEIAASLVDGGVRATIRDRATGRLIGVQPATDADPGYSPGVHVVVDHADALPLPHRCGCEPGDASTADHAPAPAAGGPTPRGSGCFHRAQVAMDADYEFFVLNGSSVAATVADVESVMNSVDAVFRSEFGVAHLISTVVVRSSPADPYSDTTDPGTLLNEVAGVWGQLNGIPRDMTQLMTGRTIDGSVVGRAFSGTACQLGSGVSFVRSRFSPSFTLRTILSAHELGHIWGAPHDNEAGSPCVGMPSGFVMNPIINLGGLEFSACSAVFIQPTIDNAGCIDPYDPSGPVAVNDSVQLPVEFPSIVIDVLANDIEPCGPLDIALDATVTPAGGTVAIEPGVGFGAEPKLRYTPPATPVPDSFTYRAVGLLGDDDAATVTVGIIASRPADHPNATEPGVNVAFYVLSDPTSVPNFGGLTPYLQQIVPWINVPQTGGPFMSSNRANDVGAVFSGFVSVPVQGVYTFYTESDEGSLLWIGERLVVDNNGLHAMQERSGTITLDAGLHAIRVEYFEDGGPAGLIARYQGPTLVKQVIPPSAWSHEVDGPPPCPADWDGSGTVDSGDFFAFIADFLAGTADVTEDGVTDSGDFFAFISAFLSPC